MSYPDIQAFSNGGRLRGGEVVLVRSSISLSCPLVRRMGPDISQLSRLLHRCRCHTVRELTSCRCHSPFVLSHLQSCSSTALLQFPRVDLRKSSFSPRRRPEPSLSLAHWKLSITLHTLSGLVCLPVAANAVCLCVALSLMARGSMHSISLFS